MHERVVPTMLGSLVRLEPLDVRHVDGLAEAAQGDRSSYGYTTVPEGRDGAERYVREALAAGHRGDRIAFAQVRVHDETVVGSTSYLNLRFLPSVDAPFAVEIGHTWLTASARGSGLNADAKWQLFRFAFDEWGVQRVDLKTDARNERARASIAHLGARLEGVLRQWQPSVAPGEAGRLRDTAMFSVTRDEWPDVNERLQSRIAQGAHDGH